MRSTRAQISPVPNKRLTRMHGNSTSFRRSSRGQNVAPYNAVTHVLEACTLLARFIRSPMDIVTRGIGLAFAVSMLGATSVPAQTPDGATLARRLNCMSCHAADRTLLGPSLADIRKRYANDPSARDRLAQKIQMGSIGAWGDIQMPANTQVNDDEAHALVDWILDPNR